MYWKKEKKKKSPIDYHAVYKLPETVFKNCHHRADDNNHFSTSSSTRFFLVLLSSQRVCWLRGSVDKSCRDYPHYLSPSLSLSCSCSRERDWAHWPSLWSDDDVLLRFFPLPTPPNLRRRIIEVKATRRRTNNCVLQLRTVGFFGLFHFLSFFFVVQHRTDLTDQIRLSADSGSSVTPHFFLHSELAHLPANFNCHLIHPQSFIFSLSLNRYTEDLYIILSILLRRNKSQSFVFCFPWRVCVFQIPEAQYKNCIYMFAQTQQTQCSFSLTFDFDPTTLSLCLSLSLSGSSILSLIVNNLFWNNLFSFPYHVVSLPADPSPPPFEWRRKQSFEKERKSTSLKKASVFEWCDFKYSDEHGYVM